MLYQVIAPYFTAGFIILDGTVESATPILRYMLGWNANRALDYCNRKSWNVRNV